MKYLSGADIESIAARVVRAYKRMPEVQRSEFLCVNPQLLVSRLLGLTLEFRHLSLDGRTLGLTSYDEVGVQVFDDGYEEEIYFLDGKTLLVERDLNNDPQQFGRCNFTIMHEGSHQIYKILFPKEYGGVSARKVLCYREQVSCRGAERNWEEWQVNALAAAVLMPPELIEKGMEYAGLGKRIEMLNRLWRRAEYDKFENVCLMLGVSKKALAIRMQQLGYLGKEYLTHPNEIMNVYMEIDEHV